MNSAKLISLLIGVCLVLLSSTSVMAKDGVTAIPQSDNLKVVGQAEMRWLMFPLYRVTLKTPDGQYQESRFPQLLDIVYLRNIDKQDLLTATDREWSRLGVAEKQRKEWIRQLGNLWPSIKRGDRLAFQVNPQGDNFFLYNGKKLGGIADKQFGKSFLDIWLSPKTSQPAIRQRLLG